jgi:hypothetical protein
LIANIGDAIAHDCHPSLEVRHNARLPERLHLIRSGWPLTGGGPMNDRRWSNERLVQRTTGLAGAGLVWPDPMFGIGAVGWPHMPKIIELFPEIISSRPSDETILLRDETISCFGADIRKQRMVIKPPTKRRATPAPKTGDSQMRTLSFILAFVFVLAPSVAGLSDSLPGIGSFAYNGSPIVTSASQALVVAAK